MQAAAVYCVSGRTGEPRALSRRVVGYADETHLFALTDEEADALVSSQIIEASHGDPPLTPRRPPSDFLTLEADGAAGLRVVLRLPQCSLRAEPAEIDLSDWNPRLLAAATSDGDLRSLLLERTGMSDGMIAPTAIAV